MSVDAAKNLTSRDLSLWLLMLRWTAPTLRHRSAISGELAQRAWGFTAPGSHETQWRHPTKRGAASGTNPLGPGEGRNLLRARRCARGSGLLADIDMSRDASILDQLHLNI